MTTLATEQKGATPDGSVEYRKLERARLDRAISRAEKRAFELRGMQNKYKPDATLDEFIHRDLVKVEEALRRYMSRHAALGGKKYA